MKILFKKFSAGPFELEIRSQKKIVFRSKKGGIKGLLEFAGKRGKRNKNLVIFDKIIGNAAALLCVYIGAKEVFGVIGSRAAKKTLKKFGIRCYFQKTIPRILNKKRDGLCPLERQSSCKTPLDFYKFHSKI